jgi:hypothetical protein
MSIVNLASSILALDGCQVAATRDGFSVCTSDRHVVQVSTRFADESRIVAALEAIVSILRARGAAPAAPAFAALEAPTSGISVDFSPPEGEFDSFNSALPPVAAAEAASTVGAGVKRRRAK